MKKRAISSRRKAISEEKTVDILQEMGRVVDRLVSPTLLLLLHQKNSHGYELIEKLEELGLTPDASVVYRQLRHLEKEGLLRSAWDTKGPGPAKRVYKLTADGEDLLHAWFVSLKKEKAVFEKLFLLYAGQTSQKMNCEPCASGDPCCEPPANEPSLEKPAAGKKLDIPIIAVDTKGKPRSGSCGSS